MTTKDEALKLALEALEDVDGIDTETECVTIDVGDVMDAIKHALAAPVQEPPDDGFTQALIERDEYHAIADELAEMIARITGEDIGEHTSANFPWRNALDVAENWLCHPPAALLQPMMVDCIGLALDLESQAKRVESQTVERAMLAAANGLRIIAAQII